MHHQEQGSQTGTRNETYNLIAVLYHALQGAENCRIYAKDADDGKAREFFEQAMQVQRQLADQGKQILQQSLQNDSGGQSAFGWQSSQSGQSGQSQSGQSQSGQGQSSLSPESGGSAGGSSI